MGNFDDLYFVIVCPPALRCYACSITSQNSDQTCLNDPINAVGQSVVNCNKKYCTIFRQELLVSLSDALIHCILKANR